MNSASAPLLPDKMSSPLAARLLELAQYLNAPLAGRLTDEQRSLCLAVARRLVMSVAQRIDPAIDLNSLWSDWLESGLPHHDELVSACFSRAEEHRWRKASEYQGKAPNMGLAGTGDEPELPIPWSLPNEALRSAYADLQIADRRRFDSFGYPALAVTDVGEDVYRHLLNEIARWRLGQVSRDRHSAAGLGDAVRHAWQQRCSDQSIDDAAVNLCHLLQDAGLLYEQLSAALIRQDWVCFIGLTAAVQRRSYTEMALVWLTASADDRFAYLSEMQVGDDALFLLEASLAALPARAVAA